jgi:hypothetical protein
MAFLTTAIVTTYVPALADAPGLAGLVTAAETAILDDLERERIESGSVVEYLDGRNLATILLREYPVTAISEVRVDDEVIDADDYTVDEWGRLIRLDGCWPRCDPRNVKVSYTAGFTTVPEPLKLAGALLCDYLAGATAGEGANDATRIRLGAAEVETVAAVESAKAELPLHIQMLIRPYRRSDVY